MPENRTTEAQITSDEAAEWLRVCATGLAELDGNLDFSWLNPAFTDLFGGARRWLGMSLATLDAGSGAIVDAARRAQTGQQRIVLRQARLHGGSETGFIGDLAFTPLGGERLLLEVHEANSAGDVGSGALSESLRGFAHEVKNPLAGVRGAAQLLARRVDQAELVELAELIIAESDRLATLADRLLRAGGKPRMARVNVHELLERVAVLIGAEAEAPTVRRDYDPSLPTAKWKNSKLHSAA